MLTVPEIAGDEAADVPPAFVAVMVYVQVDQRVSPVSEYELVADVPTCVPALYILYPVTPTASVDAVQVRFICDEDTAEADKDVGTVGAVTSDEPYGLAFPK